MHNKSFGKSPQNFRDCNEAETKNIHDFITKLSELAFEVYKITSTSTTKKLEISSWSRLAKNPDDAWKTIQLFQSLGIQLTCINEPLNTRGPFSKLLLIYYFMPNRDGYDNDNFY